MILTITSICILTFVLPQLVFHVAGSSTPRARIEFLSPSSVEANGMHNVKVAYSGPVDGELSIRYGSCTLEDAVKVEHFVGMTHVGEHHLARRHSNWPSNRPDRFVWLPPANILAGGCLLAYLGSELIGRSRPLSVTKREERRGAAFADVADAMGPWFDGVQYLQQKEPDEAFIVATKAKKIGIIGAGMSGLMTAYLLESVGIHNWKIIESSNRLGGRVHTSYLNGSKPSDYQYQEMGPMRFPVSITYADTNETLEINDPRMVFQLANALNVQNGNARSLAVNFIPWIQNNPNAPATTSKRRPDGTIPTIAEVEANPALADDPTTSFSNVTAVAEASAAYTQWLHLDKDKVRSIATNMFRAHKQAVEDGNLDFSESGYLRHILKTDWNITDQIDSIADTEAAWPYDSVYFGATTWRTIDQGVSRLPAAFGPLVQNRTLFQTKVSGLAWNEKTQKISIQWRRAGDAFNMKTSSMDFDYAVVSAPFSKVRLWRLPKYTSLLSRAINRLNYFQACKVALHYKTRFWEHIERPIYGGCGITDIPGQGQICYPSYQINSTGPGVLLGSYSVGTIARTLASISEKDYVALAQRAVVEIHGSIAEKQFTGVYKHICWENDEHQAGSWANPMAGQQALYLPSYYHTEKHTVFIGEHTSFTHAWIFSALESAVRGTAQLLLDMGLVDEAKNVTQQWMGRWMVV